MNIFILDLDHEACARYHVDSHIVKMPLETAQILSTTCGGPYKPTHRNHPCTVWAEWSDNAAWLRELGLALCAEYTYRYDKVHRCEAVIRGINPREALLTRHTPKARRFALAMPDEHKQDCPVQSYRSYYKTKRHLFKWKRRDTPKWI